MNEGKEGELGVGCQKNTFGAIPRYSYIAILFPIDKNYYYY